MMNILISNFSGMFNKLIIYATGLWSATAVGYRLSLVSSVFIPNGNHMNFLLRSSFRGLKNFPLFEL